MRGVGKVWTIVGLALLLVGQWPATLAHHGEATAGVIRSGPAAWDVTIDQVVTQRITVQFHADGPRDLKIGLPEGLPDCRGCLDQWFTVTLHSTTPALVAGTQRDASSHILIEGATWPFDQVLQITADVAIAIGQSDAAGDLPFYLGGSSAPVGCSGYCVAAGAVSLVTARLPAAPTIVIDTPAARAQVPNEFVIEGRTTGESQIDRVSLDVLGRGNIPVSGTSQWTAAIQPDALHSGWNRLIATVVDVRGRTNQTQVDVYVDTIGPQVRILSPEPGRLYIDGMAVPTASVLTAIAMGDAPIEIEAEDDSGLVARVHICIWDGSTKLSCRMDLEAPWTSDGLSAAGPLRTVRVTAEAYDTVGNPSRTAFVEVIKLL